jgi:hypothetical protein
MTGPPHKKERNIVKLPHVKLGYKALCHVPISRRVYDERVHTSYLFPTGVFGASWSGRLSQMNIESV